MQDTVAVAVPNSLHNLSHEFLDHGFSQTHIRSHCSAVRKGLSTPTFADRKSFHVFFKIEVQEFENKVEFVAIGMHDVEQADDVGILHFFEQGNLTNGCTGDTFILCFETDLLQGDDTAGMNELAGFVNDTVRSCSKEKKKRSQFHIRIPINFHRTNVKSTAKPVLVAHTLSNLLDSMIVLHDGGNNTLSFS